jgi:ribosome maturation factor RimP
MAKRTGNIAGLVYSVAEPIAKELGLTIWDIVYEKEGSQWFLRVYIERPGEILSIDDCVAMTKPLDTALDELDPTDDTYVLEVSSPGLERKLTKKEHFEAFLQKPVKVRLVRERDGVREHRGVLTSFDKDSITIDEQTVVKRSETAYIKADDENLFDDIE